jgi:hypothetical protein
MSGVNIPLDFFKTYPNFGVNMVAPVSLIDGHVISAHTMRFTTEYFMGEDFKDFISQYEKFYPYRLTVEVCDHSPLEDRHAPPEVVWYFMFGALLKKADK